MNGTVTLGRIIGIPLRLHWSFPLLLLYVVWQASQAGITGVGLVWEAVFVLAIFGCVLLHECGHALAARAYGIRSLDIVLLPLGGVVRLERNPPTPTGEIIVALAGPAVNVILAGLIGAVFVVRAGLLQGAEVPDVGLWTGGFAARLAVVNIALLVFNLIPAYPMDGGRVLHGGLRYMLPPVRATLYTARVGQVFAVLLGLLGIYWGGLFMTLIAVFLFLSATATAKAAAAARDAGYGDVSAGDGGMAPPDPNASGGYPRRGL